MFVALVKLVNFTLLNLAPWQKTNDLECCILLQTILKLSEPFFELPSLKKHSYFGKKKIEKKY